MHRLVARLLRSLDLVLAVAVSIVTATLELAGVDIGEGTVRSLTLVCVALLATGATRTILRLERLDATLGAVAGALPDHAPLERRLLLEFPPELRDHLAAARHARLVGVSLQRTLRQNYRLLAEKLDRGHVLELLVVDPAAPAMAAAAERYDSALTAEAAVEGAPTAATLELVERLRRHGQVELRLTAAPLTFGAISLPDLEGGGLLYLEHYAYKGGTDAIPKVVLSAHDGRWFEFFRAEVDELWSHGTAPRAAAKKPGRRG